MPEDTEIKLLDAVEGDENGDGWMPALSLVQHGRNELHIIVGEEAEGMAEGVTPENFERLRRRLDDRRERLLADLAAEGSSRCLYAPGAMSPEAWVTATCDCKYTLGGTFFGGESTGCCEMRAAYWVLAADA